MDERRKTLGRRIYRARRKAGFRSQKAFAQALGISEASVANAERGSDSVGDAVFTAIEDGLKWPEECIARYLETGEERYLPGSQAQSEPSPLDNPDYKRRQSILKEALGEGLDALQAYARLEEHEAARRAERRNERRSTG